MDKKIIGIVAVCLLVGVLIGMSSLVSDKTSVLKGSPKSGGETVKQVSITTATSSVLGLDGRRTHLYIAPRATSTSPITFWCSPGQNATSGFGWPITSWASSTPTVVNQIGDDVWKGFVTCVGDGNSTATIVAY